VPTHLSPYRVSALNAEEKAHIERLAAQAGLSVSNFFRLKAELPLMELRTGSFTSERQPAERKPRGPDKKPRKRRTKEQS
jgi:hypothetical protein